MHKTATMMQDLANGKKLTNADLNQIEHKKLIGIGSLDHMVTSEESENAASHLPNATLKIIDDVKHPIEKVDMSVLAAFIRDFIV